MDARHLHVLQGRSALRHRPRVRGWTMLEVLTVLAILAVTTVGTVTAFRPSRARSDAHAFAGVVRSARLTAIGSKPVAVVWRSDLGRFERIEGDDRCLAAPVASWSASPSIAVTRSIDHGIVWLADGTGRSCSGGGVYGGRVRFEGSSGPAWDVVVASSGRVRVEQAP